MALPMALPYVVARIQKVEEGRIFVLVGRITNSPRKPYHGFIDLPGGKMETEEDKAETPEECLRREIGEELGRNVVRATLLDVFAHTGKRILPNSTNRTPGLGICYLTKLDSDEIHPTEQEDVHWACVEELKLLQNLMTPWCQYFLRDLLA